MGFQVLLRPKLFGVLLGIMVILWVNLLAAPVSCTEPLPIIDPESKGMQAARGDITNLISLEQLYAAVKDGDNQGLLLDLTGITTLWMAPRSSREKSMGPSMWVHIPCRSVFRLRYEAFRQKSAIRGGKGRLELASLLKPGQNSEGWTDAGVVALRVALVLETAGPDRQLGVYDTFVRFKKMAIPSASGLDQ